MGLTMGDSEGLDYPLTPLESLLAEEIHKLQVAIRKHRDARADDRCVQDDYTLYQALDEPIPDSACQLNAPEIMIKDCERFICSRHDPAKPYLSPQREIEKLEARVKHLEAFFANGVDALWCCACQCCHSINKEHRVKS